MTNNRQARLLVLIVCSILPFTVLAETDLPTILTAPEVKYIVENVKQTLLIHSLSEIEYRIQHIPGSINIPVIEMETTDLLPDDHSYNLVFYCMGDKCSYSERACRRASAMGYQHVFWFRGGIPEWRRFNYPLEEDEALKEIPVTKLSPAEVQRLLQQDAEILLLDVRPLWWQAIPRAIANSQFMPLVELQHRYLHLPKDRQIILVDGYMKQSPSAAKFLLTKGYPITGVLKGGVGRWENEGYPTVPKEAQQP